MKTYKYIGDFCTFQLEVNCIGFQDAYYLLIAKAINEGKSYDYFMTITDETGYIKDINLEPEIFTNNY